MADPSGDGMAARLRAWFKRQPRQRQAGVILAAIFLPLFAIAIAFSGTDQSQKRDSSGPRLQASAEKPPPPPTPPPPPPPPPPPEPEGVIEVDKAKSRCVQDFIIGDIIFYVALRNTGNKDEKVDVQPIRYYIDGGENRSPFDEMLDVEVPADGLIHPAWHRYDVKSTTVLARCTAQISGAPNIDEDTEIEIPVRD